MTQAVEAHLSEGLHQEECIHLLPAQCCTLCSNQARQKRRNVAHKDGVIIEPLSRPRGGFVIWAPYYGNSLAEIPRTCDFVHISGVFSKKHLRALVAHLPNLVLIEVAPSAKPLVLRDIDFLVSRGIGAVMQHRYRQS